MNITLTADKAIQALPTEFLLSVLNGEIDITKMLHAELALRDWSKEKGCWVGRKMAAHEFEQRWGEDL